MCVVGASLAGVSAVEGLREHGYDGPIRLLGAETHLPYDRPPLSKQLLQGAVDVEEVQLRPPDWYDAYDVDLVLGRRAVGLDAARQAIRLDDGTEIDYHGAVIATGASARRLPVLEGRDGVHLLRTLDDALALRAALRQRPRVAVVGGGFIGLEVAATARQHGCEVAVVEAQAAPLADAVGAGVGRVLGEMHAAHGVEVLTGAPVVGAVGGERAEAVALADGRDVPAEVVVVGVGVDPVTDWLAGSGAELADGVCVDRCLRTGLPHVMAAGDVARVRHGADSSRIEHWTNAVEHGRLAGRNLVADEPEALDALPTFWSDQFDVKIRTVGCVPDPARVEVCRLQDDPPKVVGLASDGARLCGVITVNAPRQVARLRPLIGTSHGLTQARDALAA